MDFAYLFRYGGGPSLRLWPGATSGPPQGGVPDLIPNPHDHFFYRRAFRLATRENTADEEQVISRNPYEPSISMSKAWSQGAQRGQLQLQGVEVDR